MKTRVVPVGLKSSIRTAVDHLRRGDVIALPTDTVYGVAADGFNPRAIEKLFTAKERPRDKAIPLLLGDPSDLQIVSVEMNDMARMLAARFWPGALTLVLRAAPVVPPILVAEGNSVAVRVPDHPIPRQLARALGHPLAATSANISSGPNPSTASQVILQLGGRIPLIIDGGEVGEGVPSTVIDLTTDPPRVVRAGALRVRDIEQVLGQFEGAD